MTWLYIPPSTSSASVRAEPDSISASSWHFQTLARSCWWRGKRGPSQHWYRRWKHVSWLRRLCGAMCEPSTAAHGAASWMASLAESRASLTASPENERAKVTNATSGPRPGASSSSLARGSSSSRTSAACSPHRTGKRQALSVYGETYSDLVTRLSSESLRRRKSARAMNVRECSSSAWPTPMAADSGEKVIPTSHQSGLIGAAANWSTPLPAQVSKWVTPTVNGNTNRKGSSKTSQDGLHTQAVLRFSLLDHPISTVGEESSHIRRTLNPLFVEWLMGWPRGWTSLALMPPASNDCACSATALSAWKQRMRSALLQLDLPDDQPVQQHLFA